MHTRLRIGNADHTASVSVSVSVSIVSQAEIYTSFQRDEHLDMSLYEDEHS